MYSVVLERQKPTNYYFQICHSAVVPPCIVEINLNAGAQLHAFPYITISKLFLHSDALTVK